MYSKGLKEYLSISDYTSSEQEMGSGSPTCKTYIFYSRSSCGNGARFTLLQNNDHPLPLQKKICSLCKGMCLCVSATWCHEKQDSDALRVKGKVSTAFLNHPSL